MPIPPSTTQFEAEMDPAEILDYEIQLREGAKKLLEDVENADSYVLELYPEAVALGLNIKSGGDYDATNDGSNITIWFDFDVGFQNDVAFDGDGATLAMELSVVTDNVPPRHRQRTLSLKVKQL